MKKLFLLLIMSLLFLVGCSGQKVVNVTGETQNWQADIAYEIGKHEQIGKGSMDYLGSESLSSVSYEINYPERFNKTASGNWDVETGENQPFTLKLNLPEAPMDSLYEEVENITIAVSWETLSGDRGEETIEFVKR